MFEFYLSRYRLYRFCKMGSFALPAFSTMIQLTFALTLVFPATYALSEIPSKKHNWAYRPLL